MKSVTPVLLLILDGFGHRLDGDDNAIALARTPNWDRLRRDHPYGTIDASERAVGLPRGQFGNSEVGHLNIGAGRIVTQDISRIDLDLEEQRFAGNPAFTHAFAAARGHTLHILGLLSDGNVHSNISHLLAMLKKSREMGLKKVYCHILLDGRDVPETSALEYVVPFEAFLAELSTDGFDARIASGGGRMNITMDRYEADWSMVDRGWHTHILGEGDQFASASEAVKALRVKFPGTIDQDLPPFVIAKDGKPVGDLAPDVWEVASLVTPNPGGVGPMTRAMLLANVVDLAHG